MLGLSMSGDGNPVEVQARGLDLTLVDLSFRLTGTNRLDGGRILCTIIGRASIILAFFLYINILI